MTTVDRERRVDFAERARRLMHDYGWTQAELVRRLSRVTGREWAAGNVSRDLSGERRVSSVDKLLAYADAFGVNPAYFVPGFDPDSKIDPELFDQVSSMPLDRQRALVKLLKDFHQ